MDRHCHDISIGLYCRDVDGVSCVFIHTYSEAEGAAERVVYLTQALIVMAGLEEVPGTPGWLRFPCGAFHERGLKRAFLDVCRAEPDAPLRAKPLTAFDKKADCNMTATPIGGGVYQFQPEKPGDATQKRAKALATAFDKLCDMTPIEGKDDQVRFDCGANHDALVGSLLFRAQNVRSAMREEEQAAARGVLAAPSQQK